MPKTYTSVPSVSTGDVYQASTYNTYTATNVSNLIVPPMVQVRRTTNLTSYSSGTDITWESEAFDTDDMWTSGASITIQTAGLYVVTFTGGFGATATLTRVFAGIVKSGTSIAEQECQGVSTGGGFSMAVITNCAAAATLTGRVTFTGGSAYVVNGNASETGGQTRMTATWIGRTS